MCFTTPLKPRLFAVVNMRSTKLSAQKYNCARCPKSQDSELGREKNLKGKISLKKRTHWVLAIQFNHTCS